MKTENIESRVKVRWGGREKSAELRCLGKKGPTSRWELKPVAIRHWTLQAHSAGAAKAQAWPHPTTAAKAASTPLLCRRSGVAVRFQKCNQEKKPDSAPRDKTLHPETSNSKSSVNP